MKIAFLALLFLVCLSGAQASDKDLVFNSGTEFLNMCTQNGDFGGPNTNECLSYIAGVSQGVQIGWIEGTVENKSTGASGGVICQPNEVTLGQAGRIVWKYIHEHPERAHVTTGVLVEAALKKAFPCK